MSYLLKSAFSFEKSGDAWGCTESHCCLLKTLFVVSQQPNENAGRTMPIQCSTLSAQFSVFQIVQIAR